MSQLPMRAAKALPVLGLALWAAAAGAAEYKADYDKNADFTRYKTWTWRRGTPAPNPAADKRLREDIESAMAARGLSRVEKGGDLEVVYHAAGETEVSLEKLGYKDPEFGTEATKVRVLRVGTLLLDMIDSSTGKVVWRGRGQDAAIPAPQAVERMIAQGVDQLFRLFPPQKP